MSMKKIKKVLTEEEQKELNEQAFNETVNTLIGKALSGEMKFSPSPEIDTDLAMLDDEDENV